jgi:hypothetical protein
VSTRFYMKELDALAKEGKVLTLSEDFKSVSN